MACFQTYDASVNYRCTHAHHPQANLRGISPPCRSCSPGFGICHPWPPQSYFGSYLHAYPNMNRTWRILQQTQACSFKDWLTCQGQEKLVFLMSMSAFHHCLLSWKSGAIDVNQHIFWLWNEISVDLGFE